MLLNRGMSKPMIRIESDGTVATTHVYNELGVELDCIQAVDVHFGTDGPPQATMHILELSGSIQAEVAQIIKEVVPPPKLEESHQLVIGNPQRHLFRMRSRWQLTKYTPLPTWGTKTQLLARGWCNPVSPITVEKII